MSMFLILTVIHRYRKMAVFLHPDKMRDVENARECFEQVGPFIFRIFKFCIYFMKYLKQKKLPAVDLFDILLFFAVISSLPFKKNCYDDLCHPLLSVSLLI